MLGRTSELRIAPAVLCLSLTPWARESLPGCSVLVGKVLCLENLQPEIKISLIFVILRGSVKNNENKWHLLLTTIKLESLMGLISNSHQSCWCCCCITKGSLLTKQNHSILFLQLQCVLQFQGPLPLTHTCFYFYSNLQAHSDDSKSYVYNKASVPWIKCKGFNYKKILFFKNSSKKKKKVSNFFISSSRKLK